MMLFVGLMMIVSAIGLTALLGNLAKNGREVFLSEAVDYALVPPAILALLVFGIALSLAGIYG